ncbi:MAG: lipoyl(octanoyl) transferase LipB [Cocleimonas sp.]|nr:lipoyl(octanoyl) transferase LipB [Cocleimonas sp.]
MGTVDQKYPLKIKQLGKQDYQVVWLAMQDFTKARDKNTSDEIWVVSHPPTFTLGRNGKEEHILQKSDIPIIKVDRGGQVTYHGPGQIVVYFLLDLHRRNLGIRQLVTLIEDCLVSLLEQYKVEAYSDKKAPGVYVDKKKIAALGLRVSKGCTSHGLSLNVDMDLTPFNNINPCGYQGLEITQCVDLGINDSWDLLAKNLLVLIKSSLEEAS